MKTKAIKTYLHGRKLVLSRQEQQTFDEDYLYYRNIDYPEDVARQYAMDHYSVNKRSQNARTAVTA